LQGLTTNNVDVERKQALYSAFLNAQGRVLWDTIIYPHVDEGKWGCLIEVDAVSVKALLAHLRRHKLRSKIQMNEVGEEYKLWHIWNDEVSNPDSALAEWNVLESWENYRSFEDPRLRDLGHRLIIHRKFMDKFEPLQNSIPLISYTARRYLRGIPEGPNEIQPEHALPQESNFDHLNGIDFRKGCYVGQELTIRTQHTGVIRKRILPCQIYLSNSSPPSELTYVPDSTGGERTPVGLASHIEKGADVKLIGGSKRSAGKWITGIANIGLALCRLETMTDIRVSAEGGPYKPHQEFSVGDYKIQAFVPLWLREKLQYESERKGID
jgi:folate-binding protein YgfZ